MNKKRSRIIRSIFLTVAILLATSVFLFVGYYLGVNKVSVVSSYDIVNQSKDKPEELDFSIFWEVWNETHERYVDPGELNDKDLIQGAIKGMVEATGDPYSTFMPPNQTEIFTQDLQGSFGGIGVMIELKSGELTVTSPLADSPAEEAGIQAGDIIISIDGKPTSELNFEEMVSRIRGKIGTKVEIIVFRPSQNEELTFEVKREEITVESVNYEAKQDGEIGYIRISQFGDDTVSLLESASSQIDQDSPQALIVDLRNNPGGYLEAGIDVASFFIEDGVIVYQASKDSEKAYRTTHRPSLADYPIVVLVNQGSASAAEILAGALRDRVDAPLIGNQTFGKGSVQDLKKYQNWGSLRITSGRWLTPNKQQINGEGISPNIKVDMEPSLVGSDNDQQLNRAIKYINNNF